jgi:hypothetical protein
LSPSQSSQEEEPYFTAREEIKEIPLLAITNEPKPKIHNSNLMNLTFEDKVPS